MATIVYDSDGVDGGGNLFAGKKFFFLKRVPTRQRWVDLVKANAGGIVKLEQQADIIIADHLRKDNPVGSVSWKFIEDSVKAGELKDIKSYPAGPTTHTPRLVGSGQPTRQTRRPFSAEDDNLLANWVIDAEHFGGPTKGNNLFKMLEEKNNRHTWQSWRDRWVKYVSQRPRPNPENSLPATTPDRSEPVAREIQPNRRSNLSSKVSSKRILSPEMSAELGNQARPHKPRFSAAPATSASNSSTARYMPHPNAQDTRTNVRKFPRGTEFTNQEIQLLIDEATDINNLDENQTIDAWIAWANEHPNHTAQEWRNCFKELVAPGIPATTKSQVEKATYSDHNNKRVSAVTPRSDSSGQDLYERATNFTISPAADEEVSSSQPAIRHAGQLMGEKEFRKELSGIAKGLDLTLDFNPVICGRTVSIYRLWKIVWSDEFGGFNEVTRKQLWAQVARVLNFHVYRHSNAAEELQSCYSNILQPLDAGQEAYEATELSKAEDQMIDAQLLETATRETQNRTEAIVDDQVEKGSPQLVDNLNPRLSPSWRHTPTYFGKRRLDLSHNNQRVSTQSQPSNKRQRTDKGKAKVLEIPSTPELDAVRDQLPRTPHRTSQVEDTPLMDLNEVEEESEPDLFVKQPRYVDQSSPTPRRTTEPETQDFYFPLVQFDETESLAFMSPSHRKSVRNKNKESTRNATRNSATRPKPQGNASAQPQTKTQPTPEIDLVSLMGHYTTLGYSGAHIIQALEATTMNTKDVGIVLEGLRSENRIPPDIRGVWTSSDDKAVEEKDHLRFKDVLKKHGKRSVDLRRGFLADQKAAREQLSRGSVHR